MAALIIYLIVTSLIGFAMAVVMVSEEEGIGTMGNLFNPMVLRKDPSFGVRATIIILFVSYTLMPLWGVGYWIVRFVKMITKGIKR